MPFVHKTSGFFHFKDIQQLCTKSVRLFFYALKRNKQSEKGGRSMPGFENIVFVGIFLAGL